jgi:hypothetical protein
MTDAVTYWIELGVGMATLAISYGSWRRGGGMRLVAIGLAVAGLAATVHALVRLA